MPTADSIGRDLRNWEAASYAKSNIRIERENVLLIAFALEFNERQCNRLLMSINQHDLHVGGGATETIVGYCLKSGLPFAHAKKLYDIYSKLDTEIYHACVPKSQKNIHTGLKT